MTKEAEEITKFLKQSSIRRLNHIRRYSSIPVIRQENVAEHSFWVAFFSKIIGEYAICKFGEDTINIGILLSKALLHDIEESITGDIIRTFKYHNKDIAYEINFTSLEIIHKFIQDSFIEEVSEKILRDWEHSKDATNEGKIIKVADMLCSIAYCIEEKKLGNKFMISVMQDTKKYINKLKEETLYNKPFDLFLVSIIEKFCEEENV